MMKNAGYTFEMLLNDIHEAVLADNERAVDERALRENMDKLIIIQMLLNLALSYSSKEYDNEEKLKNSLAVAINGDELLSGYMFFISQNCQFNYSWSYMRKRRELYCEYLAGAILFLNNVVDDINLLVSKPRIEKEIHVVFGGVIDVALLESVPFARSSILWQNFYRMVTLKRAYDMSVKMKDNVLVAGIRRSVGDTEKLIDLALAMFK